MKYSLNKRNKGKILPDNHFLGRLCGVIARDELRKSMDKKTKPMHVPDCVLPGRP